MTSPRILAISDTLRLVRGGPPLWVEAALLGERLAERLDGETKDAAGFLARQARLARDSRAGPSPQPLDWLCERLSLSSAERSLIVLAGMAEEHEGYGAVFSSLHPAAEARPTVGLFARLHWPDASRLACLRLFHESCVLSLGLVRAEGAVPWPMRTLTPAPILWPLLHGLDPDVGEPRGGGDAAAPVDPGCERAVEALRGHEACAVLIPASPAAEFCAGSLAEAAGWPARVLRLDAATPLETLQGLMIRTLTLGETPVLRIGSESVRGELACALERYPGPFLLIGASATLVGELDRPIVAAPARPLSRPVVRDLWRAAALEAADAAEVLAARFPAPPAVIRRASRDAAFLRERPRTEEDLSEAMKARLGGGENPSVRRLAPTAAWDDLILPPEKLRMLRAAADRLRHELRVLDDWGFGGPAHGHRGVRLLFAGLPGTGKTLAAEVLAGALGVDLLVVDLAGVVSKWIGETEKNLSVLFDQAESTRAVLFFDEADALFGKRTEVSDAHDRYANIETSFLLARLDRFDGVAVLATNLRQNLDKAFVRRFDAIVDFPEPGPAERAAIWRRHMPSSAPLAEDVDLEALADRFPMSGAMIRNAVLNAAFAAAEGQADARIAHRHLHAAVRLEFDKAGRPHPT
jgi:hypothetical protein